MIEGALWPSEDEAVNVMNIKKIKGVSAPIGERTRDVISPPQAGKTTRGNVLINYDIMPKWQGETRGMNISV